MKIKQDINIILASTSKIRKRIMEESGLEFKSISPDFDEEKGKAENQNLPINELALFLAKGKAASVSKENPESLVIGSDQICELLGEKIDKSNNEEQAISQLKKLNGKVHFQNNALVIMKNGEVIFQKISKVELEMRKMQEDEILSYVKMDQPWGSAGSYKYESLGKHLFAKINGDYYSILGLNIQEILNFLHQEKFIRL